MIKSLRKGGAISQFDELATSGPETANEESMDASTKKGEVEAYGMTIPLLTTSNGEKFGKSAGNAVWLDQGRTGISDFYQVCRPLPNSWAMRTDT